MPKRNFLLSLLVLCIGLVVPRTLRAQQMLGVSLPATLSASWSDSTLVDTIVTSYVAPQSGSITLWEAQFYPAVLNGDGSCPQPVGLQLKVLSPVGYGSYTVVSVGNVFDPQTLLETRLGITTCPVYGTTGFTQDNAGAVLEFTEPVPLQISAGDVIAFTVTSQTSAGYALEWTSGSGFTVLTSNSAALGATVNPSGGLSQPGYAPEILVEVASTMTLGEILPLPFPPAQVTAGIGTSTFITPFVASQGGFITNWSAQFDPSMIGTDCEPTGVQLSVIRPTAPQTLTVESLGQVFDPMTQFQGLGLPIFNGCPSFGMYSPTSVLQFTEPTPLEISGGDIIGVTFTPYSGGSYLPFAVTNSLTTRYVTGTVSVGQTIDLSSSYTGTMGVDAPAIQVQEVPGLPIQPGSPANLNQTTVINSTPTGYEAFNFNFTTAYNASTFTAVDNTVPYVSASGVNQANYTTMVAGTSLATTTCYIAPGEGTDSSGNSLCVAITLTCTNADYPTTAAGDQCPTSTVRNLFYANQLETSSYIGGSSTYATSIPAGTAPTLAMGSDTWSASNGCILTGLETGELCPHSVLTQLMELSTDPKVGGGGTSPTSNSTFILGCCEPEWNTAATVPAWTNNTTVPVSFTASPPTLTTPTNGWVAAPNQSITWGWEPLGATPDPTYPVPGDETATNPTVCPFPWPAPGTTPPSFTTPSGETVTVPGEGLYEVHFFSTACDEQEELVFTSSTVPTQNWAGFKTVTFGVDETAPTVTNLTLSSTNIVLNSIVTATFTCIDPPNATGGVPSGLAGCGNQVIPKPGSGPAGPAAPTPNSPSQTVTNFPVPTSAAGPQTLTVWATDLAGNTASASVGYQVLKGNTTTAIISNTPSTSAPGQPVAVSFSVTGNGSPTGSVTVSASPSGPSCTGALTPGAPSAGSCTLYFYTVGSWTLTASYPGDLNFNGSTSAGVTQWVVGPLASVSPSSINFGTVYLGTITVKSVTVTDVGNAPMTITTPFFSILSGGDPSEFAEVNLCPKSLPAGKSCTIEVAFAAGPYYAPQTATLSVTDSAYNSPQTVPLSAMVINPQAWLSTWSLSFATQKVNTPPSAAKAVTLKNMGATTLAITSMAIGGADPGDFALAPGTTCANGVTLTPTASCTIDVTFEPSATGLRSASVVITDNAWNSPQTISLSGKGD